MGEHAELVMALVLGYLAEYFTCILKTGQPRWNHNFVARDVLDTAKLLRLNVR